MSEKWKADAWDLSATHLQAIAVDRLSGPLSPEDKRTWTHTLKAVVPALDRKARSIRERKTLA